MTFSTKTKNQLLAACSRHCCICHKFCGLKIELHHIVQKTEGGKDTADNCIPLCFECHGDMRSYDHKHPKGTKYTPAELRLHRDSWYQKVQRAPVFSYSSESAQLDRQVLERLKELLPPLRSIRFIRQNNFAGFGFRHSNLDDFEEYLAECEDPAFEFIDAELEALRAALTAAINGFENAIAMHTYPTGTGGGNIASVPQDWEIDQRDRFKEAVKEIHDAANQTSANYDALIRACRRKLGR